MKPPIYISLIRDEDDYIYTRQYYSLIEMQQAHYRRSIVTSWSKLQTLIDAVRDKRDYPVNVPDRYRKSVLEHLESLNNKGGDKNDQ